MITISYGNSRHRALAISLRNEYINIKRNIVAFTAQKMRADHIQMEETIILVERKIC